MRILVLGGGISALSAAWNIRKANPLAKITLLEKGTRLGGAIQTVRNEGAIFERGPRTFAVSRSPHLLRLIEEMGLAGELLYSKPEAAKRYLWNNGVLRSASAFIPMALPALMREAFISPKQIEDESIYDYCVRRLNPKIAENIVDPMTLGIYSGDIKKLSLRASFPYFFDLEQKKHSILRGMLTGEKKDHRLFTLKRGIGSLIEELKKKIKAEIVFDTPVEAIERDGVVAKGKFWKGDLIISGLPGQVLGKITGSWPDFPTKSLWVVSLAFKENVLTKKGFGYLIPTKEKEELLGMVWDSSLFLRESSNFPTILTAMVRNGGDGKWAEKEALSALKRHLGIMKIPDRIDSVFAENGIPQFEVGYLKRLSMVKAELKDRFPSLKLVGNYISGASVDACIQSFEN